MTTEIGEMFLALQLAARERYVCGGGGSRSAATLTTFVWFPRRTVAVVGRRGWRGCVVAGLCGGVLEGRVRGGEVPQHRCQGGLSSSLTHCPLWERVAEGKIMALRRHSA